METIVYLVRHGETDWNRERRFQGQKDIPLNQYGKRQANKLADYFVIKKFSIDSIYSSDLKRAVLTAEFIAMKLNHIVHVHYGLRERNFGDLEGKKIDDIKQHNPGINLANIDQYKDLNIEEYNAFKSRIYHTILNISENHIGDQVVIVCHGAAINAFLHEVSEGNMGSGKTKIDNTSITTVVYNHRKSQWKIENVNDLTHIDVI